MLLKRQKIHFSTAHRPISQIALRGVRSKKRGTRPGTTTAKYWIIFGQLHSHRFPIYHNWDARLLRIVSEDIRLFHYVWPHCRRHSVPPPGEMQVCRRGRRSGKRAWMMCNMRVGGRRSRLGSRWALRDSPSQKYDVKIERREPNGNITEWLLEILVR